MDAVCRSEVKWNENERELITDFIILDCVSCITSRIFCSLFWRHHAQINMCTETHTNAHTHTLLKVLRKRVKPICRTLTYLHQNTHTFALHKHYFSPFFLYFIWADDLSFRLYHLCKASCRPCMCACVLSVTEFKSFIWSIDLSIDRRT